MKKLLFILLLLPTVSFAQNDAAPAEWTPALIIFFSILAMLFLWITLAIIRPLSPDDYILPMPRKKDYSHIDTLNKEFYNLQRQKKPATEVNRRQIAANIQGSQPLVPYEPNKDTEALIK